MFRLLKCRAADVNDNLLLDDEVEYDQCPMDEGLQMGLRFLCSGLLMEYVVR